jgi:hypothetical protein
MRFHLPFKNLSATIAGKLAFTFAALCLIPFATRAEPTGARKQTVREWKRCGKGVELHLSAPASSQGGLLLVKLKSASPLAEVNGEWSGQKVEFWREDDRTEIRRALLGVDLERPEGKYTLSVDAQSSGGEHVICMATVAVKAGRFATERLSVAPQFVEPSAEDLKRANEERERLRAIFASVTPERMWQSGFRVPLDGVKAGGNFGRRRILNGEPGSPHGGVDFPAAAGTPVHSAQRGRVVLAEELFFSGNTVVVDHGLGIYTFYGHLSAISVKARDVVDSGALLGQVGATGRVTGPHLHWGLTVNRARVNPLQIVKLLAGE